MSKQVKGYVTYAITAAAMSAARATLTKDRGLPKAEWTAAHREAVKLLSGHYGTAPIEAGKNSLAWGSGFTFEGGSAPQKALSRVCGLITGETQKAMREQAKVVAAFKRMDKGERVVARVESSFAALEKLAKREDLSSDAKRAIVRHAKHLLLLCSK